MIFTTSSGRLNHGRTGEVCRPKPLTGQPLTLGPEDDPREVLVDWMTAPDNPYFAKVMANRVWAEIDGPGAGRSGRRPAGHQPAEQRPLLDALADDFRQAGLRHQEADPHDHDVVTCLA